MRAEKKSTIAHGHENAMEASRNYNDFSANGNYPLNFVSQSRGAPQNCPLPSRSHPQKLNLVVYTEELTHLASRVSLFSFEQLRESRMISRKCRTVKLGESPAVFIRATFCRLALDPP